MTKAERDAENLLMEFDKIKTEKRDVEKEYERLQALVEALDERQYGGWVKMYGAPRRVPDAKAIAGVFEELGRPIPTKPTKAPLIVRPVTS
jgi:hypothetical protein